MDTMTTQTQHTPGPWTADKKGIYACPSCKREINQTKRIGHTAGGPALAQVFAAFPEGEANGRLIAAAPELLEQLTVAVNYFVKNNIDGQDVFLHEMQAAIAKAEGRG